MSNQFMKRLVENTFYVSQVDSRTVSVMAWPLGWDLGESFIWHTQTQCLSVSLSTLRLITFQSWKYNSTMTRRRMAFIKLCPMSSHGQCIITLCFPWLCVYGSEQESKLLTLIISSPNQSFQALKCRINKCNFQRINW